MKMDMRRLLLVFAAVLVMGFMPSPSRSTTNPAPPSRCEVRFSAWCVAEGAYTLSRVLGSDGVYDKVWTLTGRHRPDSKLVVFEPNGCNSGPSDSLALLGVEKGFSWDSRRWDRVDVRLKRDASCDLRILMPVAAGDPMEWAYSTGLSLIRTCTATECPARNLGDLKPEIGARRQ